MTVETQQASTKQAPCSDDFDLARAVDSLLSDQSVEKLSPYRKRMDPRERYSAFGRLSAARGRRYVRCTLDNLQEPIERSERSRFARAKSDVSELVRDMPARLSAGDGGAVLIGPPGTGKDHMLFALMRSAILDHGFQVMWRDGIRLFAEIKSAIATNSTEDMLRQLSSVHILAVSDPVPPKDELTAYEMGVLRDIFERRYSNNAATWVTTNVQTSSDATRLFTSPLLGRLLDGAIEVRCDWGNYRQPRDTTSNHAHSMGLPE